MRTLTHTLIYVVIVLIVLILGGLVGWYFFLHSRETSTAVVDSARGLGIEAPSFGGNSSTQSNIANTSFGSASSSVAAAVRLWEADKTPVAGAGFVNTASTTRLYWVERASGYIFSGDPQTQTSTRLNDSLNPKIYEAFFTSDGSFVERSISTNGAITTFAGAIKTSTSSSATTSATTLRGINLVNNIQTIAVNPITKNIFYLVKNQGGGVVGYTSQWDGSKQKQLFASAIGSWNAVWLADNRIILTESPADDVAGYAYLLGNTGALTPLKQGVLGLTTLPASGSSALIYGSSAGGTLVLFAQGATSSVATQLSVRTIADKCVWLKSRTLIAYCAVPITAPAAGFLGEWYRGSAHTSDAWWEIDVSLGTTHLMYAPDPNSRLALDVEDPTIDDSGNYIAFTNASDKSLWVLRITQ